MVDIKKKVKYVGMNGLREGATSDLEISQPEMRPSIKDLLFTLETTHGYVVKR